VQILPKKVSSHRTSIGSRPIPLAAAVKEVIGLSMGTASFFSKLGLQNKEHLY